MELHELPAYDGSLPIDIWKAKRERDIKRIVAAKSPMLERVDAEGNTLYVMTEGGNLRRTSNFSTATRAAVIARDGGCVECGASGPFEVHHIVRYIDGGSNELDNLQTLCEPCHRGRGGK